MKALQTYPLNENGLIKISCLRNCVIHKMHSMRWSEAETQLKVDTGYFEGNTEDRHTVTEVSDTCYCSHISTSFIRLIVLLRKRVIFT